MYCANCGTPLTQGLSYCNRCGANLRQERTESKTSAIAAFLTAITTIGVAGLAIMLGGALALKKKAGLDEQLIGIFMLFVFLIVSIIELMLIRNLSKLTSSTERTGYLPSPQPVHHERLSQGTPLGEPVSSVTENTTRTLEYARREQ
jgi:hypothetical protein